MNPCAGSYLHFRGSLGHWALAALLLAFAGCQSAPTKISEETATRESKERVLADTRNALDFESFHLPGSVALRSEDFLVLKNPRTGTRVLDPDMEQTIERLAKRGISPAREVVLISDRPDSIENKKWNWLLLQLGVKNVVMMSLDSYRAANPDRVPQAPPSLAAVWKVERPQLILREAQNCFVGWSDRLCL